MSHDYDWADQDPEQMQIWHEFLGKLTEVRPQGLDVFKNSHGDFEDNYVDSLERAEALTKIAAQLPIEDLDFILDYFELAPGDSESKDELALRYGFSSGGVDAEFQIRIDALRAHFYQNRGFEF
jgi:hypothetical protein